ncbi:type ISP restriction/modification enzyme [uncultured Fibrobacter sp.]|uniref:type ISP restriction/modification enzyme n=1 Tax=uncultured Fibrobacter sp. TaxID=261512 RepID=UPI0026009B5B|nr:type ISP restriction/modification enzyme [uncultured Fibrobacter sp.]
MQAPQYFFVPKDFSVQSEYEKGFKIDELMNVYNSGIQTKCDNVAIHYTKEDALVVKKDFIDLSVDTLKEKYDLKDSSGWNVLNAKKDLVQNDLSIIDFSYKPFDRRKIIFSDRANGFIGRPRLPHSAHILNGSCALILSRQYANNVDYSFALCVKELIPDRFFATTNGTPYFFPLFLYPTENEAKLGEQRKPNLDESIWSKIDECVGNKTTPEQVFDYIYGVLHTPSYREHYKEFLKIDFPRIPYPENADEFNRIAAIGEKLRKLHLMQEIPQPLTVSFNTPGDNVISDLRYEKEIPDQVGDDKVGKVFINKSQCFENIPELAWNFYIGGYQPAQKWLKDRKNRTLTYDDIEHYRKIIAILVETHNLMQKLDKR